MTNDTRSTAGSPFRVGMVPEPPLFSLAKAMSGQLSWPASAFSLDALLMQFPTHPNSTWSRDTFANFRQSSGPFDDQFAAVVDLIESAIDDELVDLTEPMVLERAPQTVPREWIAQVDTFRSKEHPDFVMPDADEGSSG